MKGIQTWITDYTSDVDETSSLGSNHRDNVRLPRIELPSFDSQYKARKVFFDMFKGILHEQQSLPKVQKLYYLQGALKKKKNVFFHICLQLKGIMMQRFNY